MHKEFLQWNYLARNSRARDMLAEHILNATNRDYIDDDDQCAHNKKSFWKCISENPGTKDLAETYRCHIQCDEINNHDNWQNNTCDCDDNPNNAASIANAIAEASIGDYSYSDDSNVELGGITPFGVESKCDDPVKNSQFHNVEHMVWQEGDSNKALIGIYFPDWAIVSTNPMYTSVLSVNLDKVNWSFIAFNPTARSIILDNLDRIDWKTLSESPWFVDILEQNQDKIEWKYLSGNIHATHILEKNLDKIDWMRASYSGNLRLLKINLEKIQWGWLCATCPITQEIAKFIRDNSSCIPDNEWAQLNMCDELARSLVYERMTDAKWKILHTHANRIYDQTHDLEWYRIGNHEEIFEARRSEEILAALYNL